MPDLDRITIVLETLPGARAQVSVNINTPTPGMRLATPAHALAIDALGWLGKQPAVAGFVYGMDPQAAQTPPQIKLSAAVRGVGVVDDCDTALAVYFTAVPREEDIRALHEALTKDPAHPAEGVPPAHALAIDALGWLGKQPAVAGFVYSPCTVPSTPEAYRAEKHHAECHDEACPGCIKQAAHIVLDLETLSTQPDAVVASIGAVALTASGHYLSEFHAAITTGAPQGLRHVCPNTCAWWDEQTEDAKLASIHAANTLLPSQALAAFTAWVLQHADPKKVKVWGNGSSFDNVILSSLYADYPDLTRPWAYWNDRDMRTVLDLHPQAKSVGDFEGVKHNALHDARHEAKQLAAVLRATTAAPVSVPVALPELDSWRAGAKFALETISKTDSLCWLTDSMKEVCIKQTAEAVIAERDRLRAQRLAAFPAQVGAVQAEPVQHAIESQKFTGDSEMRSAFEIEYGQRWADPEWRHKTSIWASAWHKATALTTNALDVQRDAARYRFLTDAFARNDSEILESMSGALPGTDDPWPKPMFDDAIDAAIAAKGGEA